MVLLKLWKLWDATVFFMAMRSQARLHKSKTPEYSCHLCISIKRFPSSPTFYTSHINGLQNQQLGFSAWFLWSWMVHYEYVITKIRQMNTITEYFSTSERASWKICCGFPHLSIRTKQATLLWQQLLLSAVMDVGLETSLRDRTTSVVTRILKSSEAHSHALPAAYYKSFGNLLLCPAPPGTDHLYVCPAAVLTLSTCISSSTFRGVEMRTRLQKSDALKTTKLCFIKNCQAEGPYTKVQCYISNTR